MKHISARYLLLRMATLLWLLCPLSAAAQHTDNHADQHDTPLSDWSAHLPKRETRAVWLTTISGLDWPRTQQPVAQQSQLTAMLDRLQQCGINTVLVQTRVRATTIYPSALEPWDGCMTGTPGKAPSYDPLALIVSECHRRGMEVQAWVVTIPIGEWNSIGARQLRKSAPELVKKIGKDTFMNPDAEGTAAYLARVCREIVSRYDVDGIHLDYIRYPEQWKGRRQREHITRIVRAIQHEVKSLKPWVKMSCSPVGKHADLARYSSRGWNARDAMAQDAQRWLEEGLMDELFPMMYFRGNQFHPFAIDWAEHLHGGNVATGLGIYFLSPSEGKWPLDEVTRQMYTARRLGLGHAFFRTRFLLDNEKGIFDFTRWFNRAPALTPALRSAGPTPPPAKPQQVQRLLLQGSDMLVWQAPAASGGSPAATPAGQSVAPTTALLYNVYASSQWPVDTDNPENLMATRVQGTRIAIPMGRPRYWAVTAMDRYGRESEAAQQPQPAAVQSRRQPIISSASAIRRQR